MFNHNVILSDIILQEEEVSEVKWATKDEIINLIQSEEFFNGKIFLDNVLDGN